MDHADMDHPDSPASVLDELFGRSAGAPAEAQRVLDGTRADIHALLSDVAQRCVHCDKPPIDEAGAKVLADLEQISQMLAEKARSLPTPVEPLRVVLLGRTQAGKSTLFSFLTGSDASPAGNGAQRFTRSVVERPMADRADITVIDTPGVGALDGDEDRKLALDTALRADLVVWVATTNSQPSETATALSQVAHWGVPMLLVFNCREDLGVDGAVGQFLAYPESTFAALDGHRARLARFLEPHGQRPLQVLEVHAAAALLGATVSPPHTGLLRESRVGMLAAAIHAEADRRRHSRRAVAICDSARRAFQDAAERLTAGSEGLVAVADSRKDASSDFGRRADRLLADVDLQVQSETDALFRRHADWADRHYRCADDELQARWDADERQLRQDADELLRGNHARLCRRLRQLDEDVATAWSKRLEINLTKLNKISATGTIPRWAEAAGRTAIGAAGAAVGGLVGGMLGNAPGAYIGVTIGAGVGERIGALLRIRRGQMARRRTTLQESVRDALDVVRHDVEDSWTKCLESVRDDLADRASDRNHAIDHTVALADHASLIAEAARSAVAAGDIVLLRALLGLEGRGRLADHITAVRRHPGFASLALVQDAGAFREWLLRPPAGMPEPVRPVPADSESATFRRVAYALDAGRRRAVLVPDASRVRVHIPEDLSRAMLRVEANLIGRVVEAPIDLQSTTARLPEAIA